MFKITRSMLNRKIKENRKNIGINSQCLTVKYDEATNSIRTSNIRSTRYKKYVVELIKSNLESNNLEYNADNLELVVLDEDCKYYIYKIEAKLDEDEEFFEEWVDKFKALKNIIPATENFFEGKGRDKKFKAEFRRKGKLLLTILKTLN